VRVRLPNGGIITSYATAELVSSELPIEAKQVHVFNEQDLTEYSLLSVSKLCKAGLHVVFTDSSVKVYDSNHTTRLHGHKDPHTGLYMVRLSAPTGHALTAYPSAICLQLLSTICLTNPLVIGFTVNNKIDQHQPLRQRFQLENF
jgi:hypothetical protein